jgi:signal transduction histidine kinase
VVGRFHLRADLWTDSRFWILQIVVLALALLRLAATVAFHLETGSVALELSTFALFLVPLVYAALTFGFDGAIATAGWITLLAVPRFATALAARDAAAAWIEVVQVVLLDVLAAVIGLRVTAEREAREVAVAAERAHLRAVALYRELFDSNRSPILIVDADGQVAEVNPAAEHAFGSNGGRPGSEAGAASTQGPIRLVDVIGPQAAAHLLTTLMESRTNQSVLVPASARHPEPRTDRDRVPPVSVVVDGHEVLYRPSSSIFAGPDGDRRMQVVFEDVTAETHRKEQVEAFASRIVSGQEDERRHLAHELHDGPLQTLIHLCRQIDALESTAAGGDAQAELRVLRAAVEGSVAELRTIAQGLRPSILDDLGLVESVHQLLVDAAERQQFEASFGVTGTARRLGPGIESTLFRIAQEALSNVERHAAARRVSVGIDFESGGIRLLVTDDGVGFDPADPAVNGGGARRLGITGMTERVNLIQSRLTIHSDIGAGTAIDVWVPATVLDPQSAAPRGIITKTV